MYRKRAQAFLFLFILPFTKSFAESKGSNHHENKVVNLAIWSHYIGESEIKEFEAKTGIKIKITNYSSNEELLAKLQAGATGFDVAVPSDYMVAVMAQLNLIHQLDKKKIPNFSELNPKLLDKEFDKGNQYSVPYGWGTTGIAINTSLYKGTIHSWKELFEKDDLKNKFALLDDVREALGAALKSQGYSINSTKPDELNKAKEILVTAKKKLKMFSSETIDIMQSGDIAVAQAYSTDALQLSKKMPGKIKYVIPQDGSTYWMDNLVIPKGAKNIDAAHQLINFMIDKKTNIAHVKNIFSAPVVKDTSLLPKELLENNALMPTEDQLRKTEMMKDLGESTILWDQIWTEVKAAK